MKHEGDLTITAKNIWQYQELTEVSGSVDIRAEHASLPALTEVSGYVFETPSPEMIQARLREVAQHALKDETSHTCKTTHCIAGWAIHLAGATGYDLERRVGPSNAGLILLGTDAAAKFRVSDDDARAWLRTYLP